TSAACVTSIVCGWAPGDTWQSFVLPASATPVSETERSRALQTSDRRIIGPPFGHSGRLFRALPNRPFKRRAGSEVRQDFTGSADSRVDSRSFGGSAPPDLGRRRPCSVAVRLLDVTRERRDADRGGSYDGWCRNAAARRPAVTCAPSRVQCPL